MKLFFWKPLKHKLKKLFDSISSAEQVQKSPLEGRGI